MGKRESWLVEQEENETTVSERNRGTQKSSPALVLHILLVPGSDPLKSPAPLPALGFCEIASFLSSQFAFTLKPVSVNFCFLQPNVPLLKHKASIQQAFIDV